MGLFCFVLINNLASVAKTINLKGHRKKQVQLSTSPVGIKIALTSFFQGGGKLFLKRRTVNILSFLYTV